MDPIKLKVVSDGSVAGTYVTDQDGRTVDNIIKVQYGIDMDGVPQIFLTLVGIPVEISYNPTMVNSMDEIEI